MSTVNLKKTTYHHGNLRTALLDSALQILQQDGQERLSLRRVGGMVGVSQSALYSHFKDKTALLASIAALGFEQLAESMKVQAAEASNPAERVCALGLGYVLFALDNGALFKLMFGNDVSGMFADPELKQAADSCYMIIFDAIGVLLQDNTVQQAITTTSAWAMVHGLAMLLVDGRISAQALAMESQQCLITEVLERYVAGLC